MRRIKFLMLAKIIFCAFTVMLTSCGVMRRNTIAKTSATKEVIGTFASIAVYDVDKTKAEKALESAFRRAFELEQILSLTVENSELSNVNKLAFENEVVVSNELFFVLESMLPMCKQSNNALNVAAGELIALWGIGIEKAQLPKQQDIDQVKGVDAFESIILNKSKRAVSFTNELAKINLGAVGKGYFADEIKLVLLQCGADSALIDFGGNVLTVGLRPDGTRWRIGITNPFDTAKTIGTIEVENLSVVTSGNYEKFFEKDGVRYHHIFNTTTGYPSENDLVGVTIVGESSMICDALSTTVFAMGAREGMEFIKQYDGYEALTIDRNGAISTSSGFKKFNFKEG